ncbi:hypothetical protein NPIL_431881 [Nephila pilipes]|uniref:Uncharacterized protein n=1 Tax=Nephila pilipes TaxID=299642 RepID=A0A8X6TQR3_NEPPI|nr:hypothetical protein NPIL_431881 [Nephila pilipes]
MPSSEPFVSRAREQSESFHEFAFFITSTANCPFTLAAITRGSYLVAVLRSELGVQGGCPGDEQPPFPSPFLLPDDGEHDKWKESLRICLHR